jgi:hypothetical protein
MEASLEMMRIPVDFNTMNKDSRRRIWINTVFDASLLNYLKTGLRAILYEPGLEVEAVIEFDVESQRWLGVPDWSTRHDIDVPVD